MKLSERREAEFRAWWQDLGVTIREMARRLGGTDGLVNKMGLARWGPRPPGRGNRLTDGEIDRGRRLVRHGASVGAAARALGRSRSALADALRKSGQWGRQARALRMLRAGRAAIDVAEAVGASPELVRWWRKEAGLEDGRERKRRVMSALMRREHANRRVVREVGQMVAALDAGWPLCSPAERRALEALAGGPGTAAELGARVGRAALSMRRTLARCVDRAWAVRERVGGEFVWRLSEAVAERRKNTTGRPGG